MLSQDALVGARVQMETRAFGQSLFDQLRFVCAVIIQDQVNVELLWHCLINKVKKFAKLDRTVSFIALRQQLSRLGVKCGK